MGKFLKWVDRNENWLIPLIGVLLIIGAVILFILTVMTLKGELPPQTLYVEYNSGDCNKGFEGCGILDMNLVSEHIQ